MPNIPKYSNYLTHEENQAQLSHSDDNQSNLNEDAYSKHNHSHNHHSDLRKASGKVLMICFIATFFFSLVEGIGGYLTHSIALKSDALHMLTDAAGLLIAYFANSISRKPATINLTFGYGKAEAVGALMEQKGTLDEDLFRNEVLGAASTLCGRGIDLGAILLECSELPPYSADVQKITGLPVFDFVSMIRFMYMGLRAGF